MRGMLHLRWKVAPTAGRVWLLRSLVLVGCVTVLDFHPVLDFHSTAAAASTLIVPQDAIDQEGPFSGPANFSAVPFRIQFLYPSEEFASRVAGRQVISGISLRPDFMVTEPRSVEYPQIRMMLSTTAQTIQTLSQVFDQNTGPDDTVVYDGDITLVTQAEGDPAGPRPFDYKFPFQQPFTYDPTQGNLLLEVVAPSGFMPAQQEDNFAGIGQVVGVGVGELLTGSLVPFGAVAQFDLTAACDLDGNGVCDHADVNMIPGPSPERDQWFLDAGYESSDFNLDGSVTASRDGAILLTGLALVQGALLHEQGDANGDGHVTASIDGALLLGALGAGPSSDGMPVVVAEPGSLVLLLLVGLAWGTYRRGSFRR